MASAVLVWLPRAEVPTIESFGSGRIEPAPTESRTVVALEGCYCPRP